MATQLDSGPPVGAAGTVTFLFTDISRAPTRRWESHREAMKEALARHERIVSDAIAKRGGYVFKTVGDAFCAAPHVTRCSRCRS